MCVHLTRISIRAMGLGLRLGVVSHVDHEILAVLYTAVSAPRDGLRNTVSKNDLHAPAKIGKINASLRIDLYPRGFTFRRAIVLCMGAAVTMTIRDCVNDCRRWKRFYIIYVSLFFLPRPAGHNGKLSGSTKTAVIHLFSSPRTRRADNVNNMILLSSLLYYYF